MRNMDFKRERGKKIKAFESKAHYRKLLGITNRQRKTPYTFKKL